jgi:outer membrane protein TolC
VNRVLRDLKLAYYNVALAAESERLTEKNRAALGQTLKVVESRYAVGQASQAEVLKAHAQFTRMLEEIYKLGRERQMAESEIARLTGGERRVDLSAAVLPPAATPSVALDELEQVALRQRPQLNALQSLLLRSDRALDLARHRAYPKLQVCPSDPIPPGSGTGSVGGVMGGTGGRATNSVR